MYLKPFDWVKSLDAEFNDAVSFRHMHRFATEALAKNERIRNEIVAVVNDHPEEKWVLDDWDKSFGPEDDQSREAIRLIDERMAAIGAPL